MKLLQGSYSKVLNYCRSKNIDNYYVFETQYTKKSEKFTDINRFLWESRHECTRFENDYTGAVLIGLTDWNEKELNSYFDSFMYFLKDYLCQSDYSAFYVEDVIDKYILDKLNELFIIDVIDLGIDKHQQEDKKTKIGFCIESYKEDDNIVRS